MFNCEEAKLLDLEIEGVATKNLFLKDRKGKRHFLVVVIDSKVIDLKSLSNLLDVNSLSLASSERLEKYLGTEAGSVSILDILKDSNNEVELIIDESILSYDSLQCHPLTNTATLDIPISDIKRLFEHYQRTFKAVQL